MRLFRGQRKYVVYEDVEVLSEDEAKAIEMIEEDHEDVEVIKEYNEDFELVGILYEVKI